MLLQENFKEFNEKLENLKLLFTFGGYFFVSVNKDNFKSLHKDNCNCISNVSALTIIGYTKRSGLILSKLNRTIDIQEGDIVFLIEKLFHDVEKFKSCRKSIICYSHKSNFKDETIFYCYFAVILLFIQRT
ncbi:hypothetical protein ABK040_013363 [Willaertia magna]